MTAKSNRESVADYRKRLVAEGGREVRAYVDAEAAKALDAIMASTGEGVSEVVRRALVNLKETAPSGTE